MLRSLRIRAFLVGLTAMTVSLTGATAAAAAGPSKADYKYEKRALYSWSVAIVEEAQQDLVYRGSPADVAAFYDRVLTEVLGAASAPPQVPLSETCTAGVAPVRKMMAKWPNSFGMPWKKRAQLINERLADARIACSNGQSVEWANFYATEFDPWFLSQRSRYEFTMTGTTLKMRPVGWQKYRKIGQLCQKFSFDENGWLVRTTCNK